MADKHQGQCLCATAYLNVGAVEEQITSFPALFPLTALSFLAEYFLQYDRQVYGHLT